MVCSSDTANVEQSKEKIITAFATMKLQNNTLANVRRNLIRRAQLRARPRGRRFQQFLNWIKLAESEHSASSRTNVWKRLQMLVEIITKSVELYLDHVRAYSINVQSHFPRKRSFVWKNFILHFSFSFSCRIAAFSLVPPVTWHPVYITFRVTDNHACYLRA